MIIFLMLCTRYCIAGARRPSARPPLDNDTDTVCVRGGRERWLPKRGGSFSASSGAIRLVIGRDGLWPLALASNYFDAVKFELLKK